jgi:hypothetical protein
MEEVVEVLQMEWINLVPRIVQVVPVVMVL